MLRLLKMLVLPLVAGSMIAGKSPSLAMTSLYLLRTAFQAFVSRTAAAAQSLWINRHSPLHKAQLVATVMHCIGLCTAWTWSCFNHSGPASCDCCSFCYCCDI